MTLLDTGQVVGGVGRWPSFCCCWRDPEGQRLLWLPGPGAMVALGQESKRGPARRNTFHTAHRLTGMGCAQTLVLYPHMCGDKAQTLLTALLIHAHACTHMLRPHALLCTHAPTPSPLRHTDTHTLHTCTFTIPHPALSKHLLISRTYPPPPRLPHSPLPQRIRADKP